MPATRPRTLDPTNLDPLATWLAGAIGASRVEIARAELLSGGAVQENWRIDVTVDGGPRAGAHSLVLRTDAAARLSMAREIDASLYLSLVSVPVAALGEDSHEDDDEIEA